MNTRIKAEIRACLPNLRAFARSLAGVRDRADDLVQDAVLRVLDARSQFMPGTDFKAWTFTILRNLHFNEIRHNHGPTRHFEEADLEAYSTPPLQQARLEFDDFRLAFAMLPAVQREALVLIGAEGYAYEEAAVICGCPIGTIKSRVGRARRNLKETLGLNGNASPATACARATPSSGSA